MINIGTVNCGDERNRNVCREQAVSKYPRIKFYADDLSPSKQVSGPFIRGKEHKYSKKADTLVNATIQFLMETERGVRKTNNIRPKGKGWRYHWRRNFPNNKMMPPMLDMKKSANISAEVILN